MQDWGGIISCEDASFEPSITSFTPDELIPGETLMSINGTGFGDTYEVALDGGSGHEVCFEQVCYSGPELDEYVYSWGDGQISFWVPEGLPLEDGYLETGYMGVTAYSETLSEWVHPESEDAFTVVVEEDGDDDDDDDDAYVCVNEGISYEIGDSFDLGDGCNTCICEDGGASCTEEFCSDGDDDDEDPMPEITSFSPTTFVPEETLLTITGSGFGDTYVNGMDIDDGTQVCFADGCISDYYIDSYLVSWSDTEVQVYVPSFVTNPGTVDLVVEWEGVWGYIESEEQYSVDIPDAPEITSISPTSLIPEQTIVTITGSGFGDTFDAYYNQICFGDGCLADDIVEYYLVSWSDTEVQVYTPWWAEDGAIDLLVYFSGTGWYDYVSSPSYTINGAAPIIDLYYYEMETGGVYDYTGYNFGDAEGKVVVDGKECEIISWSDTDIYFRIPDDAGSGKIYIETSDGLKTQELDVVIATVEYYSDDEYSSQQWYLDAMNVPEAWEVTEGDDDIVVAVIDSGVDIDHEDLEHAIWENDGEIPNNGIDDDGNGYIDDVNGWDFYYWTNNTEPRSEHGTMVASTIAAEKDNNLGIAGVAPNVKIMPLNVAFEDGLSISVDGAIYAIQYAVDNGADVINMSFGGYDDIDYYRDAVEYAYNKDVLLVAAAGNETVDMDDWSPIPACTDLGVNAVVGVAALDVENVLAWFSNYGEQCTDISAPGQDILMALPEGGDWNYGYNDGTSFASPLTAGVAALIRSEHPDWNVEEVKQVLFETSKSVDSVNPLYAGQLGYGIPDAYAALQASKPSVGYTPDTSDEFDEDIPDIGDWDIEVPEPEPYVPDDPIKDNYAEGGADEKPVGGSVFAEPFADTRGHKYETSISYIRSLGIVDGYDDGTYRPDERINRAEFTKIVLNALEISPSGNYCFPDVKDLWYAPYVCAALSNGIINGYDDGNFKPNNDVNVAEALRIVLESTGFEVSGGGSSEYWYMPYVNYAQNSTLKFLIEDGKYDKPVTRGEMAEMIYQIKGGDVLMGARELDIELTSW